MSTEKITKSFLFYVIPLCLLLSYIFTTCYGEELDDMDDRISTVEDQLKLIQEKVDANKWVSSVTAISNGYRITFSDNTTIDINHGINGKDGEKGPQGEPGRNGTEWKIIGGMWHNVTTGESTHWYAGDRSPEIVDGHWVFYEWSDAKIDYDTIVSDYVADTLASYLVDWGRYYELYMPFQSTDPTGVTSLTWKMIPLPKYKPDLDPPLVFNFLGYARIVGNGDTIQMVEGDFDLPYWYLEDIRDHNGNPVTENDPLWKWKWRRPQQDIVTGEFRIDKLSTKWAVVFSINRPDITTLEMGLIDSRGSLLEAIAFPEKAKNFDKANGFITKASSNNDTVYYARMRTQTYFPGQSVLDQQKGKVYYRLIIINNIKNYPNNLIEPESSPYKSELSPYPINLVYKYAELQPATIENITAPHPSSPRVADTFKIAYDDEVTRHSIRFTNASSLFDHYIHTDSVGIDFAPVPPDSVRRTFRLDTTLTPPATYKFPIDVYTLQVDGVIDSTRIWIKAE
ncbi:MAG: DUF4988 domain-containing protein [Tannerellaceae bacterium]|jgi:hypothetical protein|nr:DUF4988 domain-containing protein [Tannerellaceae bacterium]